MPLPKDRNAVAELTTANKPGKAYIVQRAFLSMGGEIVWSEIALCNDPDNAEWIADALNRVEREQRRKRKSIVKGLHTS